jgi:hypothetical protein
MNFRFELLNIHINHLTQLEMINIALKCEIKNVCKKNYNFHLYLTWFLVPLNVFAPFSIKLWTKLGFFYSHDIVIASCTFLLINIHYSYDIKNFLRVHPKFITLCEGTCKNIMQNQTFHRTCTKKPRNFQFLTLFWTYFFNTNKYLFIR